MCGMLKASFYSVMVGCPFYDRRVIQLPDSNIVNERLGERMYDSNLRRLIRVSVPVWSLGERRCTRRFGLHPFQLHGRLHQVRALLRKPISIHRQTARL